jgi:6-phosphogluconate dehydrogenase
VAAGRSGGVTGLERGYCLMIGGEDNVVQHLARIFATLTAGVDPDTVMITTSSGCDISVMIWR